MGVGPRFEATPSWRLSILMVVIVCVSYSVEKFFHWVDHKLAGHDEYERSSSPRLLTPSPAFVVVLHFIVVSPLPV